MEERNIIQRENVTLIGTAHVSKQSVEQVKRVISSSNPDVVAVELDPSRFESIMKDTSSMLDLIANARRYGFPYLFFSLTQKIIGLLVGVSPGAEFKTAIQQAEAYDCELALIDVDFSETFSRAFSNVSRVEFLKKIVFNKHDKQLVKRVTSSVQLSGIEFLFELSPEEAEELVRSMFAVIPSMEYAFLDRRNEVMARNIARLQEEFDGPIVVVVGYAHVAGILRELDRLDGLEQASSS